MTARSAHHFVKMLSNHFNCTTDFERQRRITTTNTHAQGEKISSLTSQHQCIRILPIILLHFLHSIIHHYHPLFIHYFHLSITMFYQHFRSFQQDRID